MGVVILYYFTVG